MAYWLMKTEPGDYSYYHLEQNGRDVWDGVKNFAAQKNIRGMHPGDLAFIYHTGKEKSIIGVAEIVSPPYSDPNDSSLFIVLLEPRYRLNRPVSLAEIKQDPVFSGWELVRLPRLSVMPVPPEFWSRIHGMAGNPDGHNSSQEGFKMKMKIEKIKKNAEGDITDVMMNGSVYSINQAIMMARDGKIDGVNVAKARSGREYLRSNPDGSEANNLDNLPAF